MPPDEKNKVILLTEAGIISSKDIEPLKPTGEVFFNEPHAGKTTTAPEKNLPEKCISKAVENFHFQLIFQQHFLKKLL
jgi:hypothetical protein